MILREEFGGGNFMDTWYRVFFLDSSLKESWTVVDVRHDFRNGPSYVSTFEKIEKDVED